MDLVTQGVIGATFAQSISSKKKIRAATLAGFLGGLAPDADTFIRSSVDPLLSIEFHRHFTHSLLFIPLGALLPALLAWLLVRRKVSFKTAYLFSFAGYATHGLLDACTSYGTRLLWPFSNERIAWDNIAIIDLFFTLPLLAAMLITLKTRKNSFAKGTMVFCIAYLFFGVFQRERAIDYTVAVALKRGHANVEVQAKPTFAQLLLWKTIYKHENKFYVDAVRLGFSPFFRTVFYQGESSESVVLEREFSSFEKDSTLYKDILRFNDFSSGMLIFTDDQKLTIGDARYSILPNSISPLWGIHIDPSQPEKHVGFVTFRSVEKRKWDTFLRMIAGRPMD